MRPSPTTPCETSIVVPIEFDHNKERLNVAKHGVSLSLAAKLDWNRALLWIDDRRDYGESRLIALALHQQIVYFVAIVRRGPVIRVISLRRANRREANRYVEFIKDDADPPSRCR
jgi:uncharacterized DUF497 family protein